LPSKQVTADTGMFAAARPRLLFGTALPPTIAELTPHRQRGC
jgi:hypothetical protein